MNQKYSITRTYKFEAAHRVEGHPKCGQLHGHSYKATICISSLQLDSMGFVIDFGDVDSYIIPYIDAMDHHLLVSKANVDEDCPYFAAAIEHRPSDVYYTVSPQSTAEYLAQHLGERVDSNLPRPLKVAWVEIQETERNKARWEMEFDV